MPRGNGISSRQRLRSSPLSWHWIAGFTLNYTIDESVGWVILFWLKRETIEKCGAQYCRHARVIESCRCKGGTRAEENKTR